MVKPYGPWLHVLARIASPRLEVDLTVTEFPGNSVTAFYPGIQIQTMKTLFNLACLAALFGAALTPCAFAKKDKTEEVSAADLPAVPASLVDRKYVTKTTPDLEAKVYFIYQSRYMCPNCVKEAPEIVAAYKKMKGKGAELVMLNVDSDEETAAKWAKKAKMRFPIVAPGDRSGIPFPHEGRGSLPCMVALDADGNKLGQADGLEVAQFLSDNWKKFVKEEKKQEKQAAKDKAED